MSDFVTPRKAVLPTLPGQPSDAAYVKRCGEKCWQDGECDGSCKSDAAVSTEPELRYAGFWSKLDCDVCGDEIEVEGDVATGERYRCETCGEEREVYGR